MRSDIPMEYYLRFSSKTRQHKKRADCLHLSTKKPQPVVSGKIWCFLALQKPLLVRFVCRGSFQTYVLRYVMIAPMGPQNQETTESM